MEDQAATLGHVLSVVRVVVTRLQRVSRLSYMVAGIQGDACNPSSLASSDRAVAAIVAVEVNIDGPGALGD